MTKINDGGPAFPSRVLPDPRLVKHLRDSAEVSLREAADALGSHPGMTLRDWFAGQALAGWLASYGDTSPHPAGTNRQATVAKLSYRMADAMLAERAKEGG
jgi:hypothetical protein